jgi:hypothetical protein
MASLLVRLAASRIAKVGRGVFSVPAPRARNVSAMQSRAGPMAKGPATRLRNPASRRRTGNGGLIARQPADRTTGGPTSARRRPLIRPGEPAGEFSRPSLRYPG